VDCSAADNSAYIWSLHPPTVFYMANVLLHLALVWRWLSRPLSWWPAPRLGCSRIAVPVCIRDCGKHARYRAILWLHILLGIASVAVLFRLCDPIAPCSSAASPRHAAPRHLSRCRIHDPPRVSEIRTIASKSANRSAAMTGRRRQDFTIFPVVDSDQPPADDSADFFMDSKACGEFHQEVTSSGTAPRITSIVQ